MLELDDGGNYRVIDDRIADNLAGSRATKDGGSFEVAAQLIDKLTCLQQRSGAENKHDILSSHFIRWQIWLPPVTFGPFVLCGFPIENKEE